MDLSLPDRLYRPHVVSDRDTPAGQARLIDSEGHELSLGPELYAALEELAAWMTNGRIVMMGSLPTESDVLSAATFFDIEPERLREMARDGLVRATSRADRDDYLIDTRDLVRLLEEQRSDQRQALDEMLAESDGLD